MTAPRRDWALGRRLWGDGQTASQIAAALGCTRQAVDKHAKAERWERTTEAARLAAHQRAEQTRAAVETAHRRWAERRAGEADAAGITAAVVRQAMRDAAAAANAPMLSAAARAYDTLIRNAQLLSGGATERAEALDAIDAEVARLVDQLRGG
ncbi:MAG: hypothetical protein IPM45_04050 [Acidimicrobiales bacterium]|nr:hypothetical protein [Acidimicrobiales bacterium]